MLAYSIGRIILSIKAISSSVRPYFLYSISSVHGWEKLDMVDPIKKEFKL